MNISIKAVAFCLLPIVLYSQNLIYFNKTFNLDTPNTTVGNGVPLQNGYLFTGNWVWSDDNNTALQGFLTIKTDFQGNVQMSKNLYGYTGLSFVTAGGDVTATLDGNYLLVGTITYDYVSENEDLILIKYNSAGDTIWRNTIEKPMTVEQCFHVLATEDGGYIIAGRQRTFSQNGRLFVLKTDSLGNEEWSSQYHPLQHGAAFSVFETDTGYIVSGYMQYLDTDHDMFVMEIDKQGSMVWEKNYGGNESDNACLITPIAGDYFLMGAIKQNNITNPFIAKISQTGDTLWSKTYSVVIGGVQEAPLQPTPDGGFVCLYSYDTELGYRAPWFWRFTATGDTLWTRRIPGAPSNNNTYLKDIAPTHDGGWVLSGFNYSQQSSWVVKTDSLGYTCSFIGCDSTVVVEVVPGIPGNLNSEIAAMVYPVPASTNLYIRYQIPAAVLPSGNAVWRLYNALGSQVAEAALPGNVGVEQVSVAQLPAGIYYYRVVFPSSGQTVASGKVVVE